MKKVLPIVLLICLLLVGCKSEREKTTILCPNGMPSVALTYLEESDKYDIRYTTGQDLLSSAFINESYDFIIAPFNLGVKLYNMNRSNYKLSSLVTLSSYYLVSGSNIGFDTLDGKDITLFSQNNMPDIISSYVFNELEINPNKNYVSSSSESLNELVLDNNKIVLLSISELLTANNKISNLNSISISDKFNEELDITYVPQAALFTKADISESVKEEVVSDIKESVNKLSNKENTINSINNISNDSYVKLNENTIKGLIDSGFISCVSAKDIMDDLNDFVSLINTYNADVLKGELKSEFIY